MSTQILPVNSNVYYNDLKQMLSQAQKQPSINTPFEVLNPLKPNVKHRSDNNVASMRNLLFEFDSIPLQEQIELIKKNKNYINRIVF